jgi:hypothetical protein
VPAGVVEQVGEDLGDPLRVGPHRCGRWRDDGDGEAGGQRPGAVGLGRDQLGQVDVGEVQRQALVDPGEVEHVRD